LSRRTTENFSFTIVQGEYYALLDKVLKGKQEIDNKLKKLYIQAESKIE
jgi:hypothetical protein